MATKLKGLKVSKVDFVDAGANQRANILFFKSNNTGKGAGNLLESSKIKKFISAVAKAIGIGEQEAGEALTAIAKDGAISFNEAMATVEMRQIMDEIWGMTDAYRGSLCSIVHDTDVTDKKTPMMKSTDEFCKAIKGCIEKWAAKQSSDVAKSVEMPEMTAEEMEIATVRAEALLEKAKSQGRGAAMENAESDEADDIPKPPPPKDEDDEEVEKPTKKSKGEESNMKIDKSKLTAEERMFFEAIEKKAGIPENAEPTAPTTDAPAVAKSADTPAVQNAVEAPAATPVDSDVFKSLPPAIADIIKGLQAKSEAIEERELLEVAKKYEILGKKADELVPVLKGLKKDPAQYEQTIALLDAAVTASAGTFTEIGKKGSLDNPNGSAWDKIEKRAAEIRQANPTMGVHESIDKACAENPTLVAEYEKNR